MITYQFLQLPTIFTSSGLYTGSSLLPIFPLACQTLTVPAPAFLPSSLSVMPLSFSYSPYSRYVGLFTVTIIKQTGQFSAPGPLHIQTPCLESSYLAFLPYLSILSSISSSAFLDHSHMPLLVLYLSTLLVSS